MNEYENNTLVMMRVDMGISSLEFFKVIHCMADFSCAELQYVIQVKKKISFELFNKSNQVMFFVFASRHLHFNHENIFVCWHIL